MSGIHRLLTRRDRSSRREKHNKEESSNILSRPHFRGFFSSSNNSSANDATEDQKKVNNTDASHQRTMLTSTQVKELERRIEHLGITGLKEEHINYALHTSQVEGDVEKAFQLLLLLEDSIEGIIRGYTPTTKLLGAENRRNVTCYLDALLFAMFARLDCFEAILYKEFSDEPRRKLSVMLRFWVNLLRSGRLITTDFTKHLQDALAECGWQDAAKLRQQDASEAFTFITEKLELPLLTLKMDIYHTGKEDESSDHKFVNERLLEVAIPEPQEGKTVTLEDCLEVYFNNRIEVRRHLEQRGTMGPTKSFDSLSKGFSDHVEEAGSPLSPTQTLSSPAPEAELSPSPSKSEAGRPSISGTRRDSIVQQRFIPDSESEKTSDGEVAQPTRKGVFRKEVMMPAWQFFSLIPWYTDNTPTNDAQVAAHFSSKRPILGMCLKRYSMLPNGKAVRLDTYVDIPTEIGLPHFIQDDNLDDDGALYGSFKLSLQAMVCHRGNSINSGHYIAIVRGTSAGAPPASSHGSEHTASNPSKYWMRFDDLAQERVTLVDIDQALKHESPYLLFYQILPIDEDAAVANFHSFSSGSSADNDLDAGGISEKLRELQNEGIDIGVGVHRSARPSFEITAPNEEPPPYEATWDKNRSTAISNASDPSRNSQASQLHSVPSTSPQLLPKDAEGGAVLHPRRGSRATRSNPGSRTGSQAGDNRISATFQRFTGRLSREKISNDGFSLEGDDETAGSNDYPGLPSDKSEFSNDGKEKGSRWGSNGSKDKDKDKDKDKKEKNREKIHRKLERECMIM